ncbi:lipocalin-like domain-containing protein [Nocardia sp. NPDC051756]|uniref:lipocalin-like domain-containing protein n=1 Tax=Nocardia sp. NPDC051756 TaxID=3154751 RepID=UPI003446DB28
MRATDLVGTWELASYLDTDEQGVISEGPLGDAPRGLLIYGVDEHMSVSMMRTGDADPRYKGYAGTWRITDGKMVHGITVCTNPEWAGTEQVREMSLAGDALTLTGIVHVGGRTLRRALTWRRIPATV